jgi:hypothetical protein
MIRIALIAVALATFAAGSPAVAQSAAPVRTLSAPDKAIAVAARKSSPCLDKSCAGRPARHDTYVASAPLGW